MLAPPAAHIEAEPPRLVPANLRLARQRKKLPDQIEDTRISRRITPRRPPDRRLIYLDDLVDPRHTQDRLVPARLVARTVQTPLHALEQNLRNQGTLARTAHARHTRQHTHRKLDVDALEVILLGLLDFDAVGEAVLSPGRRQFNPACAA